MREYSDKSAYKEHLTRRNYLTLLATKLATKYKPSAKIGEIREIVRKYDAKEARCCHNTLDSLGLVHKLVSRKKGICINTHKAQFFYTVSDKGNEFLKRNL